MNKINILIVDDCLDIQFIYKRYLQKNTEKKYNIFVTETGMNGIEICKKENIDCILLDYDLPDMNGIDFLKTIKDSESAIIVITGVGNSEIAVKAMKIGANDYLVKGNFSQELFIYTIDEAMQRKKNLLKIKKMNVILEQQVKERTAELEQSHLFLEHCLNFLSSHVAILDKNANIIFVNEKWKQFGKENGLKNYDVVNKNYLQICQQARGQNSEDANLIQENLIKLIENQLDFFSCEYSCHTVTEERWFLLRATKIIHQDNTNIIIEHHNITEFKKTEQQMTYNQELILSASKMKSMFMINMSHEIRTPLNAIVGMNHLLKNTHLTKQQLNYSDKISLASQILLGIVDDIQSFYLNETGKLQIKNNIFDLNHVLQKIANVLNIVASNQNVKLFFDIPEDFPYRLIGDALRLEQIIINLMNNAIKFTPNGEVILSVRLVFENDQPLFSFRVCDNGIGIPKKELFRIFDPFTQITSDSVHYQGMGIGLNICKNLVELMNGKIWAESEEQKGAKFYFQIPFAIAEDQEEMELKKLIIDKKILLVTDCKILLRILSSYFESALLTHLNSPNQITDEIYVAHDIIFIDENLPNFESIISDIPEESPNITTRTIIISQFTSTTEKNLEIIPPPLIPKTIANILAKTQETEKTSSHLMPTHSEIEVLLVEDNEINREIIIELLKNWKIKVSYAENGQEALNILNLHPDKFDIILMDLEMPIMNGFEATKAIKETPSLQQIPIIALTADVSKSSKEKAAVLGIEKYLNKPIVPKELLAILTKIKNN